MTDPANKAAWLFTPEAKSELTAESEQDFFDNPGLFKTIIESIQDGVSLLDLDLNIRYMNATMRYIYTDQGDAIGKRCYDVYHSLKSPCKDCPSLLCMQTKKPQTAVVRYDREGRESNWHQIFSIPVLNSKNEIVLIMEYVRDVTFQNSMVENMNELAQRFEALEYQNKLLADILQQKKQSSEELETTISTNVEKFIKPSLEYLKKTVNPENVDMVNGLIDEIVYPITKKRSTTIAGLTPRELQVASLIKEGYSSKEIADKLCVTQKAVDFHRLNIRKKLQLTRDVNLRSYLEVHL
ncbi:helix-turn-helix transcriptional regulator [Christensenellaceae bacterium OttesenSCG-928-K19]|nr:helix-turn-helix transcriptional regulator [Christensenellaceae bacterium OttesenSCG-928-K19]